MKNIFKVALAAVMLLGATSCEDYLTYTAYGEPASDNFWRTEDDIDRALDGLYFYGSWDENSGRGVFYYYNSSDDIVTGRTNTGADNMKNFIKNDSPCSQYIWENVYYMAKRANDIILNVPEMDITDDVKNDALAEAYYMRAFMYLFAMPYYGDDGLNGGMPILTEDTAVEDADLPRTSSVLENYDYIINDLKTAINYGLPTFSELAAADYGRPHKAAAEALIAKAALHAATWDESYLSVVDEYATNVINNYGLSLIPNYEDIFKVENNYGSEYLWSFPSSGSMQTGSMLPGCVFENAGFGRYNTWGYFTPTAELYESYEDGDLRRDATILKPYDTFKFVPESDDDIMTYTNTSSLSGMLFRKYLDPYTVVDCLGDGVSSNGNTVTTDLDPAFIRFSEVVLFKAEAQIRMNGAGAGDTWINMIRNRAGLANISGADIDDLLAERRHEFTIEFPNYMLDLIRLGKAKEACEKPLHGYFVTKPDDGTDYTEVTLNGQTVYRTQIWAERTYKEEYYHVFAIPDRALSGSTVLVQNQGW